MMRSQTLPNRDLCLACRLKLPDERDMKQKAGLFTSCADVQTTQHRCSCPEKYEAPPEKLTERVEACAVQTNFLPYQRDFSNTDTGRRMSRPFLRPHAPQHLERRSHNGARVEMNVMSGRHATNRPSPSTSSGSSGASDHILLPIIDDDYSPWRHPLPAGNDQRGASSTWRTSRAEISDSSLLHSHSDPSSQISDADLRQRYQPYTRPSPLPRYAQDSDELQPANFSDGLISPQTDTFQANHPEKYTLAGIHHHSRDYSPPSPVLTLNETDHRFLGLRDSLASIPNHHRRLPPLNLDREDRRLPSLRRPHRYETTPSDSEDRHEGLLSRYQLPTPPGNRSLHPSPLAPNFRGFSDDHRPWRSRSNYPPREVSRERDHRDVRATSRGLPTPISNSPVYKALLEDNYPNDRIPASNVSDISLMTGGTRSRNDGFTHHRVLHSAYEDSNPPLRNSSYNDRVSRPSPTEKYASASKSLPSPINDLPLHEALFNLNHGNNRFQTSGVSTTLMASDAPVRDGPDNRIQSDGSAYDPSSHPNVPQSISTLPVSSPQVAGMSYSPPTSDDEEVDQLVEDKPQSAGYSRFQFMPGNTTSRTYKTVFYPGDKGPPSSPWNTRAMLVLTDPDHSTVYADIRRTRLLEKSSKADSLDTVAPGSMSGLHFFYDTSMSETVQNSPYPRSLLFSNDLFFHQRTVEIQEPPSPESNSVSELHDHTAAFTSTSSTSTDAAAASPELDSLADDLDLINLDPENDEPKP
ncbi:hypothetical protein EV421DRAFT_518319 [Armillaria borealis]|uniref:Uncharacterized protein n=1 Tax=Armillaria borealis TaxID=47425 RepID=A0AA39MRE0_9AGAR|nr:hypothetical protein EV421DRAFT_518319 [Armillaria borealis]